MKKFKVNFEVKVYGTMEVEAENYEEAIEKVEEETLESYGGNGGIDQIVGVNNSDISLEDCTNFRVKNSAEIEEI
ncbi:MAG: hypothetical protein ACOCP8_05610 [archaeon]